MWNNPEVLSKLGRAMGNVFELPGAEEGEEGEGEEGEAVEETVHGAASAGGSRGLGEGGCWAAAWVG